MKKLFFLLLLTTPCVVSTWATEVQMNDSIYGFTTERAAYRGGDAAMLKDLAEHLDLPSGVANDFSGRTMIKAVVEKNGTLSTMSIAKSCGRADVDSAVLKAAAHLSDYAPAKNDGEIVRSYTYIPASFPSILVIRSKMVIKDVAPAPVSQPTYQSAQKEKIVIKKSFYGCYLGFAQREEFIKNVRQSCMLIGNIESTESYVNFQGDFRAENVKYSDMSAAFVDGKLLSITYVVRKQNESGQQIETLKQKYATLPSSHSNPLVGPMEKRLAENMKVDLSKIWKRYDDQSAIYIIETDKVYTCMYSPISFMLNLVRTDAVPAPTSGPHVDPANAVKEVLGCEFGKNRQETIQKFSQHAKMVSLDASSVVFSGVLLFDAVVFRTGTLYFNNDQFVACDFESVFSENDYEKAKSLYNNLSKKLENRYSNYRDLSISNQSIDADKSFIMASNCGMYQKDYLDGKHPPINLYLAKGTQKNGQISYHLILSYFFLRINELTQKTTNEPVFQVVEEMPQFPGGEQALFKYLAETVKYPILAQENKIQGTVIVSFVINTDGSIVDVEVEKTGGDASLDKEAVRVIKSMPKWIPGKNKGKVVRVKYTMPVNFRLK